MSASFLKDYFSDNSGRYSTYRPTYPRELFQYLASVSPTNEKAWDCACGTGQSALGLSEHFENVIATDASENQIKKAIPNDAILYRVSPAEHADIPDNEADIITVAQALHWFHIESFFKEADRVLKKNGILAVWTYNLLTVNEETDFKINDLYSEVLGPYWPEERQMVEDGYSEIDFPFSIIDTPSFEMQVEWNALQLIGYIETWSAVKKFKKENDPEKITNFFEEILGLWQDPNEKKRIHWPLTVIVQRKVS